MTEPGQAELRRAKRFVRVYPKTWRARYGDEFVELLVADITERPRSLGRVADIASAAALARFRAMGLFGDDLQRADQVRASLAVLGCALAVFLAFGVTMWSQVAIGWRWEPPNSQAIVIAMVLMSTVSILVSILAVLAAAPLLWTAVRSILRGRGQPLVRPGLAALFSAAFLVAGSIQIGRGWPGTGGHNWTHHALVPEGVARVAWAATRGVTSYWAHPGALASFPFSELLWMAASPAAMVVLVVALVKVVRRLELSARVLRYEARLSGATATAMLLFLVGAGCWVINNGAPGPTGIYQVGAIDAVGLVVMGAAWLVAYRAVRRAVSAVSGCR